ncbi:MAG: methyltransferase domain-containing protein [Pseudomonadota bacterium]
MNAQVPPEPLFELQRTLYSSGNYTRRRLHRERLAWVTSAIKRYGNTSKRSIEYGPGSGIYLPELASNFADVTAADIEPAYLAGIEPLLAAHPTLRLQVDDLERSSFQDGSFDFVLCSEVLEHVPRPASALREIARILLPGGIAVVTTPQSRSAMELCCKIAFLPGIIQFVRWVYREPILPTGHISLRSSRQFREMIRDSGMRVIEQSVFGLYLPLIAEFGGGRGGRWIENLEHAIADTRLAGLLWTQAYILRKP